MEMIPLDLIEDNPFQPRQSYNDIEALAEKIRAMRDTLADTCGLIHVPTGRRVGDTVQLAEGHRRLRAFGHLAVGDSFFERLPVNILELSDQAMDDIAWDENRDRSDLSPVEEARALEKTMNSRGLTQVDLASLRQMGRSTVANKLRLLRLPDVVLTAVNSGQLTERHAMELLPALEIKPEDLDNVDLSRDMFFNAGSLFVTPHPETLQARLLDSSLVTLTSAKVRGLVDQIKKEVEKAKRSALTVVAPSEPSVDPPAMNAQVESTTPTDELYARTRQRQAPQTAGDADTPMSVRPRTTDDGAPPAGGVDIAAEATVSAPPQYASISSLEQLVKAWLGGLMDQSLITDILNNIKDRDKTGTGYLSEISNYVLHRHDALHRRGDLRQACNNVLDQIVQQERVTRCTTCDKPIETGPLAEQQGLICWQCWTNQPGETPGFNDIRRDIFGRVGQLIKSVKDDDIASLEAWVTRGEETFTELHNQHNQE